MKKVLIMLAAVAAMASTQVASAGVLEDVMALLSGGANPTPMAEGGECWRNHCRPGSAPQTPAPAPKANK